MLVETCDFKKHWKLALYQTVFSIFFYLFKIVFGVMKQWLTDQNSLFK